MLKVTCNICAQAGRKTELSSNLIPRDEKEGLQLVAMEMAKHLERSHQEAIQEIVKTTIEVQALMAMLCFSSEDEGFNEETERVRDSVLEKVMEGAEEEDEEEEDEPEEGAEEEIEGLEDGTFETPY